MDKFLLFTVSCLLIAPVVASQSYQIESIEDVRGEYPSGEEFDLSYDITASGSGVIYGDVVLQIGQKETQKDIAISDGLTLSGSSTIQLPENPSTYDVVLKAKAEDQDSPDTKRAGDIQVYRDGFEVDTGSWVTVSPGDTLLFGPENQNELDIESIRERENRDFRDMEVMPGIGPGTISDDPLRIIFPDGRDHGGLTETEFNSGMFGIEVKDFNVSEKTARLKILPEYSESSDFNCENYDLSENQYAFCSNSDEDSERGAEQRVDLGHTTEIINFVRNDKVTGQRYAKTGVNHLFVNPDSGRTLQFWQQDESTYKGAEIEIIEWRGLSDEHSGNNMQAIVQIDPVSEPDASLSFGKSNYETGEEISLYYEAFEPGRYELRVSGAGQDTTESYEESSTEDTLTFEVSEEGEIQAELIAPGGWWNPLDSDRTVAEASTEVNRPLSQVNHEFGEKFSIAEDQSTKIEGRNFYLSTLVGSSENGYPSILWRSSEESNTNSPLVLLRRINSMGLQYDDGFNAYGVVCSINPDTDSAEIVVKEDRFNPWEACDRHPDELRTENDYDVRDYSLGEKVTLEPGEALEFGESRVYLEGITIRRYLEAQGHSEWVGGNFGYWRPPPNGSTVGNVFYEGEISTATCNATSNEVEIVMQRMSEIGSNWPEAACGNEDGSDTGNGGNNESDSGDNGDNGADENQSDDQGSSVQRIDLEGQAWNNIAVNIDSVSLNDDQGSCEFAPYSTGGVSGYAWTVEDAEWKALSRDQQLDPLNGYSVWARNDCTLTFEGSEAEPEYSRELYGDKWNLISLPPGIAPAQLKNSLESQGGRLYPWDGRLFWTNMGSSWIHPVESLDNDRAVYIYSNISTTVDLSEMEEGPGPGAE